MRCKKCGHKNIKWPLWQGQEEGDKFDFKKINWINLFKIDIMSIIFLFIVFSMVFAYKHDTKQCFDIIQKPCNFCATTGCYNNDCMNKVIGFNYNPSEDNVTQYFNINS